MGLNIKAIVDTIPIGRVYSEHNLRQLIAQSAFGENYSEQNGRHVRLINAAIRQLVNAGNLSPVAGGYVRGNDRQEQDLITFYFDGQQRTVNAADYEDVVARMRAEMLNRSPVEAARKRMDQLERELADLKATM